MKNRRCSGSTEWAETHAAELQQKAVVYLNSDSNGRGFLEAEGSHALEHFINDVARDITDPETKLSVWKRQQARAIERAKPEDKEKVRSRADWRIGALGSGSDYTPFLQHLGIPTLNIGFGGEDGAGVYHSIYDDFYFFTHFLDTDFAYGRTLAQTAGTAIIRLADADILPFQFANLADTVRSYDEELQLLVKKKREDIAERNREITDGVFAAINDPKRPRVAPKMQPLPPALDFTPISRSIETLTRRAVALDEARAAAAKKPASQAALVALNLKIAQSEQQLIDAAGLVHREWFKHLLYAPGFYTGYGVKTMPGVREAIEQGQYRCGAGGDGPRRQGARARGRVAGFDHEDDQRIEVTADAHVTSPRSRDEFDETGRRAVLRCLRNRQGMGGVPAGTVVRRHVLGSDRSAGDVKTLQGYTDWMKGLFTPVPDARYELRSFAVDESRKNVIGFAVFRGTHTGPGGPVPPTGKRVEADYVYVMDFDGDRIRHLTKIWNDGISLKQLGWG